MKFILALTAVGCLMLAAPVVHADPIAAQGSQAVPLMRKEHADKIREEIRLQENRAKELEPIIARDRQARHDVEVNWVVLERHAHELHARANEFRTYAQAYQGRRQSELNAFATELDTFATHDEENARFQHEVAERLDKAIALETAARDWHTSHAGRLRSWVQANENN